MPYAWPQDPQDLFAERRPQMLHLGLPADDVDAVRTAISEMWPDRPGGWVHEWSRLANGYAAAGRHDLAALAFGWAKFPSLVDPAKRAAQERQVEAYERASPGFDVAFERRMLDVPYAGGTTTIPVHLLATRDLPETAPVLLASGGVDSWKMDLHGLFSAFATATGSRVMAFDIPGTGESTIPLDRASTEAVAGLVDAARELGDGRVGHLGVSMGGYFSARTGLSGIVDAAIVLGGPVERAFAADRPWRFGMAGIVGNALGFDRPPSPVEIGERMTALSLRPLLERDEQAPMLVVNGRDDVHVPEHDTTVFRGRRATEVVLVDGAGHCAISKLSEVLPTMLDWTRRQLGG